MTHAPFRLSRWVHGITLAFAFAATAGAADFNLATTIQAGRPGNGGWELGIGPITNGGAIRGQVNNPNYFPNALPNRFELGYTSATNTAYLRYYYTPTNYRQVVYSPGGPGLGGFSEWTIPTGSLFVAANSRPVRTSVTISGLALGGGVQVLQPFSATTLTATQLRSNSLASLPGQVQFRTNAGGNWSLSGNITFEGLRTYLPRGAVGAELRMGAGATGTSAPVPEPHVTGLTLSGFVLMAGLELQRRRRQGEA